MIWLTRRCDRCRAAVAPDKPPFVLRGCETDLCTRCANEVLNVVDDHSDSLAPPPRFEVTNRTTAAATR